MSQRPSAEPCEDDEISLAVAFQGLQISVVGPASKALDFVHRLSPTYQFQHISAPGSGLPSSAPSSSASSSEICPDNVLALATRLSAASILSPQERVKRAWICGLHAKAQLESRPPPFQQVVAIDLAPKYFVVLRGKGVKEPKTLRSYAEYQKAITGRGAPEEVGCEFPSETEARAYLTAAGFGFYAGV